MDYRFNAEEWGRLSVQDRVRRCRLMADEARKLAVNAEQSLKESYLSMVDDWERLASEIERAAKMP